MPSRGEIKKRDKMEFCHSFVTTVDQAVCLTLMQLFAGVWQLMTIVCHHYRICCAQDTETRVQTYSSSLPHGNRPALLVNMPKFFMQ